jgi:DNA-binding CsgD family transcriptional regulator
MVRLSRSDLEAVLDFSGEVVASAREPERQGERLVAGIARIIDVDVNLILYARIDARYNAHDVTLLGDRPRPSSDDFIEAVRSDENPYAAHAARTRQPHFKVTRLHDLVDRVTFRRTRLYQLVPLADMPSAQMRMPAQAGSWWQLEVLRPGRQLTDRQLALLDAARPWLELYEDRRVLAARIAAIHAASPDHRAASGLSAREQEVLDRVADGGSNQDVADALHISPGTVRKHLENIYAKLEVTSRTAALARTGRTWVADAERSSRPT